jgi:hypothetical protein
MFAHALTIQATRDCANALKKANMWNRAVLYAEQDADAAMRRGDAAGEAAHLAIMQRALRLREYHMARYESLRATLGN